MERVFQPIKDNLAISKVWFENRNIFVQLNDGSTINKPIDLYPNLRKGSPMQWNSFELWNDGRWIHWETLDEDLSLEGFLKK
jgi:hypothetical protein